MRNFGKILRQVASNYVEKYRLKASKIDENRKNLHVITEFTFWELDPQLFLRNTMTTSCMITTADLISQQIEYSYGETQSRFNFLRTSM